MPTLAAMITFLITALVIILIPGPSVVFAIGRTLALGRSSGLVTVVANAMGTKVLGLHAASNPNRSGPYSDRRYCVDRYDDAARKYLGKPASALKLGTKIEHDGVMDLVAVELCSLFAKVLDVEPARQGWLSEIWVPHGEPAAYARFRERIPPFRFGQGQPGDPVQIRFPARMLDEPIAGMSARERDLTADLLQRICQNRAVIVIEHDMDFVKKIAHKVTVMHQGKILAEGPMDQVQADPKVIDVYLGH